MAHLTPVIILVIVVAILFDFTNGWNDSANAIATVVSTRVLSPLLAVLLAATFDFAGAFASTKVAKMIGGGLVVAEAITPLTILAALGSATLWNGCMTVLGLPVSGSHALIGGLLGATVFTAGVAAVKLKGVALVVTALLVSPFLGILCGFVLMTALMWVLRNVAPSVVNRYFGGLQIFSAGSMAFSHGTNDAQKVMGIITLALVAGGLQSSMEVPIWVVILCGSVMATGTALGGWKVIKTLGHGLMKMKPVHGFAAETSAVTVLMSAASLGVPVSTTHVITSSVIGVGAARKFSAVKWGVGGKILMAWVLTFPGTMLLSVLILMFFRLINLH